MPHSIPLLLRSLALCGVVAISPISANESVPDWAYPVNPPGFKAEADDGSTRHVPGSSVSMTLSQTRDRFVAPDWHPEDHSPMPDPVGRGRKPNVYACGYCHRADGPGGPENANVAGLPRDYIIQQMKAFRAGTRTSAVPNRAPVELKAALAKSISDEEVAISADYFSKIRFRSVVKVVESDRVPMTRIAGWVHVPSSEQAEDPIGERIVEVPDNPSLFELRDSRATFTAFVPLGSIARGAEFARTGGPGGVPCSRCHGEELHGQGNVPGIAGRSPSYIARQLWDFKLGVRGGDGADPMKPVVASLTAADILNLAAFIAASKQ